MRTIRVGKGKKFILKPNNNSQRTSIVIAVGRILQLGHERKKTVADGYYSISLNRQAIVSFLFLRESFHLDEKFAEAF